MSGKGQAAFKGNGAEPEFMRGTNSDGRESTLALGPSPGALRIRLGGGEGMARALPCSFRTCPCVGEAMSRFFAIRRNLVRFFVMPPFFVCARLDNRNRVGSRHRFEPQARRYNKGSTTTVFASKAESFTFSLPIFLFQRSGFRRYQWVKR